jgi:hypothetical protein
MGALSGGCALGRVGHDPTTPAGSPPLSAGVVVCSQVTPIPSLAFLGRSVVRCSSCTSLLAIGPMDRVVASTSSPVRVTAPGDEGPPGPLAAMTTRRGSIGTLSGVAPGGGLGRWPWAVAVVTWCRARNSGKGGPRPCSSVRCPRAPFPRGRCWSACYGTRCRRCDARPSRAGPPLVKPPLTCPLAFQHLPSSVVAR